MEEKGRWSDERVRERRMISASERSSRELNVPAQGGISG